MHKKIDIMDKLLGEILKDIEYLDKSIIDALHDDGKGNEGLERLIQEL